MLQALQRVTDAALAHLELDDLLPELVEHFRSILEVDVAAVLLMEDGDGALRLGAVAGVEHELLVRHGGAANARNRRQRVELEAHGREPNSVGFRGASPPSFLEKTPGNRRAE
jgi:hypothetical protein